MIVEAWHFLVPIQASQRENIRLRLGGSCGADGSETHRTAPGQGIEPPNRTFIGQLDVKYKTYQPVDRLEPEALRIPTWCTTTEP